MYQATTKFIATIDNSTPVLHVVKKNKIKKLDSHFSKAVLKEIERSVVSDINFTDVYIDDTLHIVIVQDTKKTKEALRIQASRTYKWLLKQKIKTVQVVSKTSQKNFADFLEGFLLTSYSFDKYKSEKKSRCDVHIVQEGLDTNRVQELLNVISATCDARTLVNEPLSFLTAEQFSIEMDRIGKESGFQVETWDKEAIEKEGFTGLLAVNKGSFDPPTFNILTYQPENAINEKPIVFVGKGIVYDTGGLSLKPTANSMDFMKADMGGAATVVGALSAIAKNKLPLHVVALIPCTDNRPGNNAYAPGDVIKMYSGKTVEVLNTDAEGRMVLADALHYAKQYDPQLVFDFATLTGAAAYSTGGKAISLMGNASNKIRKKFHKAGFETHERLFEFPMWDDFGDMIKSNIADIKNIGGKGAGMITAGKFLEHFTDYPWLHFDIAGCAFSQTEDSYRGKGGTGVGVRLVHQFLENYIKKESI